jgi:putative sigma-54 modulation protein
MMVQVRGKGVVVTEALREYADKRLNKLEKHFQSLHAATVTETIQGRQHRVEVMLEGDGVKVRCEERGDDLYAAMDRVSDKLERQMRKFKDKAGEKCHVGKNAHHHYGKHGEIASLKTAPMIDEISDVEPETGRITRHKRFEIKPISPGEAVEQMELLSHDFFVFENSESGEVNVLYRREDGNYGILEPGR